MNDPLAFTTLLVPVDFSPASEAALNGALELAAGEDAILILLHVIDSSLVEFATAHQCGSKEDITKQMRERAERQLQRYRDLGKRRTEIDVIVSEGVPFLEILRKRRTLPWMRS